MGLLDANLNETKEGPHTIYFSAEILVKIVLNAVFMWVRKTKDTRQLYKCELYNCFCFQGHILLQLQRKMDCGSRGLALLELQLSFFFRNFFGVMVNP